MGLCKCPRKKVTTLFCFEHRVNVCEYCLVKQHSHCIVQSYLAWLQDSECDPTCLLCQQPFADNPESEVIRLFCLHLYHWHCFNKWASQHPANTAPAGYLCPSCQEPVFPKDKQASPIVDALKEKLATANWARAGLGLPLMPEFETTFPSNEAPDHKSSTVLNIEQGGDSDSGTLSRKPGGISDNTMVDFEPKGNFANLHNSSRVTKGPDADENKYQRRSALTWLKRWLKSRTVHAPKERASSCRRSCFMMFLILLIGSTVMLFLYRIGRSGSDSDPFLDPLANPNIHVAKARVE